MNVVEGSAVHGSEGEEEEEETTDYSDYTDGVGGLRGGRGVGSGQWVSGLSGDGWMRGWGGVGQDIVYGFRSGHGLRFIRGMNRFMSV